MDPIIDDIEIIFFIDDIPLAICDRSNLLEEFGPDDFRFYEIIEILKVTVSRKT